MKLLLVDDEFVALKALKKRVDWVKYGFSEVFTAQDGASARELLAQHHVDLVLCDIEMPGENGLELVEFIKQRYPKTSCIMVTCHADFEYTRRALKSRVIDYILKPIDYEELDGILLKFIEEHEQNENKEALQKVVEQTQQSKGMSEVVQAANRIEVVKQYIEDHIREKIYIEDLAKLIYVNDQHLMRIFKKSTGQSVTEYITERRVVIASHLLKDTDYSINFVADCVGCENYSYFTKLFKKYTGFTPREYRNKFKEQ